MLKMQEEPMTWVLPQFLRAGKYSYIIEYPKGKFYFHKSIIHFRDEAVPVKQLRLGKISEGMLDARF